MNASRLSLLAIVVSFVVPAYSQTKVLIVVGPTTHPPGTHEVAAGGRLMKSCLESATNVKDLSAEVFYEWPKDKAVRDEAATIVFIGDQFPPMRLPDAAQNMADLGAMMARGCGIVCVHYATGLAAQDVADDGEHPLLHWMGGYFATRCKHHQSIAKIYPAATITPAAPGHPVARGWREFTLNDEPYIKNYLGPDAVALATSMLPPEAPQRETVAWAIERKDGGRGMGIVMPHFYRNWLNDDLRRFIMNGIVWTAKLDVPARGVDTPKPDLTAFQPASIEPKPREPKPATPAPK